MLSMRYWKSPLVGRLLKIEETKVFAKAKFFFYTQSEGAEFFCLAGVVPGE